MPGVFFERLPVERHRHRTHRRGPRGGSRTVLKPILLDGTVDLQRKCKTIIPSHATPPHHQTVFLDLTRKVAALSPATRGDREPPPLLRKALLPPEASVSFDTPGGPTRLTARCCRGRDRGRRLPSHLAMRACPRALLILCAPVCRRSTAPPQGRRRGSRWWACFVVTTFRARKTVAK